jgi:hypothetical protein
MVRSRFASRPQFGGVAVLLLALTICSSCTQQVVESTSLYGAVQHPVAGPYRTGCHTALGEYFLPKTFLRIEVVKLGNQFILREVAERRRADNNLNFCLDYLASSFSNDQVLVKKSPPENATTTVSHTQFLHLVASKAFDQTSFIIRRLIRAVFIGLGAIGARSFTKNELDAAEVVRDLSFDPFDTNAIATVNQATAAKPIGLCFIVDGYTVGRHVKPEQYCNNPTAYIRHVKVFADLYAAYESQKVSKETIGILYRPRVPYSLLVYTRGDGKQSGNWLLRKVHAFHAENLSPLIAIRVDRAMFAKKKVALLFDEGTLTNVCLFKSSELNEAVEIPLEVVKSIVRLPTEIFQIQYDQIADSNNLLLAEKQLIQAQREQLELLDAVTGNNAKELERQNRNLTLDLATLKITPFESDARTQLYNTACPQPAG